MSSVWLNTALAAFLLALAAYVVAHLAARPAWARAGVGMILAGGLALLVHLVIRWRVSGHAPMSNMHESLMVMTCAAVWLAVGFLRGSPDRAWAGPLGAILGVLGLASASLFDKAITPLMPALRSNWLLVHVIITMTGYAAFALAAAAGTLRIVRARRHPATRHGEQAAGRPDDAQGPALDGFVYRAMTIGFLLLTGGIITGAVWANQAWGTYWSWDPKETWSLITWFVYLAGLHLYRTRGWRGTRFAWAAVAGFAAVLFTYVGVNYLLSGLHSYA